MSSKIAIAIDGPVASGKTVVGKKLAESLRYRLLDTGMMYRAVTFVALERNIQLNAEDSLTSMVMSIEINLFSRCGTDRLMVDGRDITDHLREPDVERGVSLISKVPSIRSELVYQQRLIAAQGSIVMIGRDIGTVVLPNADIKIYLKASAQPRAERRFSELKTSQYELDIEQIKQDIVCRDSMDQERIDSPLRPAEDAIRIATDNLDIDQVVLTIMEHVGEL